MHASGSWRFALETRGIDCIHPVPLVDPRIVPPPADLAKLHFNDLYVPFLLRPDP